VDSLEPLSILIEPSKESVPSEEQVCADSMAPPSEGLFIGRVLEDHFNELIPTSDPFTLREDALLTHSFICGVTGAGKTVMGKIILEEAALNSIPIIAIDLKGDISSLALMMTGEDPEELIPWVEPTSSQSREEIAVRLATEHRNKMERYGMSPEIVENAKKRIGVNIFTPRTNDGFRLSLSAFPEPPDNFAQMKEDDPDAYDSLIDFLSQQFVARLSLNKTKSEKAMGYVFEIIKTCFSRQIPMHGYDGVKRVLHEFLSPDLGIDIIGDLSTEDYITSKDREIFSNATNALLTGAGRRMYEGWPVSIETLINPKFSGNRNPISIVNVSHLDFKDQAYVVGYIAYLIWFWMKRLPGTYSPRLIFYIDEIGGGGGKNAFFPSVASSPCKPALNQLLRQGRSQGVCCIFATQNPGDIDYKGLSNCGTWMVGKLRTRRDRSKIEQGAADAEIEFESASRYIPSLETGYFVVKTPSQPWTIVQERWLMSLHRPLSSTELQQLKSQYESEAKLLLTEAETLYSNRSLKKATNLIKQLIAEYPFSNLTARAFLLLSRVFIEMKEFDSARVELERLLKRWVKDDELAEAKFLLGTCHERKQDFSEASKAFEDAQFLMYDPQLKEQCRIHAQYCEARSTWPTLGLLGKLIWWISGKKPDEEQPLRLKIRDDDILTHIHKTKLDKTDFYLPPATDYSLLKEAADSISDNEEIDDAQKIKALRWAESQSTKLAAQLDIKDLYSAVELGKRIVRRLAAVDVSPIPTVLAMVRQVSTNIESRAKNLRKAVSNIEARQFEFEIARLLHRMGYLAHATKATADDGVDVFARKGDEKIVVQCKRWIRKAVGRSVVDELAGTAIRHSATLAILATTSHFSPDAQRAAASHKIELWDLYDLCNHFQKYGVSSEAV